MKKTDILIKDYVSSVSDDSLEFMYSRFNQNFSNDLADALDLCTRDDDIEKLLREATNSEEFYEIVDKIHFTVNKEYEKRNKAEKVK